MRTIPNEIAERSHKLWLENPGDPVPDGEGGYTEAWAPLAPPSMWASIAPATMADMQRVFGSTVQATATHMVGMLFHPGVTIETRLIWKRAPKRADRYYLVQSVKIVDEREITMVLACAEVLYTTAPPTRVETADAEGPGVGADAGVGRAPGPTPAPATGVND